MFLIFGLALLGTTIQLFGVTPHAYIFFVANAFALLGLRSLYFLVVGVRDRLIDMSVGLAIVFAFIGGKLVLEFVHDVNRSTPQRLATVSLAALPTILTVTAVASLGATHRDPAARAHPG